MAPLAVTYETDYFLDEGLFVTLAAQAAWKVPVDGVTGGHWTAPACWPDATIGYGTEAHIIAPFSMDLDGNRIDVSSEVSEMMRPIVPSMADVRPQHPISASTLESVVGQFRIEGKPLNMGMAFLMMRGASPAPRRSGKNS